MPVADNKSHSIDSNGSRSAQNGGSSGQQKHGSSRRGGSSKKSGSKSMVRNQTSKMFCFSQVERFPIYVIRY